MALEQLKPSSTGQAIPIHLPHWRSRIYGILGLLILLTVVVGFATTFGSVQIPFSTIFGTLLSKLPLVDITPVWPSTTETIILDIRLPRVILAGLVGAALAVAGATYQGLFRNPLADPYLIGVAQGASLGAVIGFLLPFNWQGMGFGLIPLLAFVGALLSVAIVYNLARVGKALPVTTLILAGVALGALLGSIVSYLIITSGEKMHGILFWLMGSFSLSEWTEVKVVLPYIVVGVVIILLYSRSLNIMQLTEEQAQQLGINVEKVKLILLAAATLITAAAVSFVGTIGFVGIIIPHAVRLVWGADYRFLLPLSILTGAVFLILADLVARTALAPTEIPIGVITAICGAPFFLYLLRRKRKAVFF
ncbi:MAG TPA: iron chelate uptake ABC transporter family permease subunit [Dehalococcoidia bacterium]|jgi:iron complex transport system permease protein|nr:iron chelate uptake ABC transporter family permease subunit [Dehalococcoidia bacterium]